MSDMPMQCTLKHHFRFTFWKKPTIEPVRFGAWIELREVGEENVWYMTPLQLKIKLDMKLFVII